jgi:hypothetical protein
MRSGINDSNGCCKCALAFLVAVEASYLPCDFPPAILSYSKAPNNYWRVTTFLALYFILIVEGQSQESYYRYASSSTHFARCSIFSCILPRQPNMTI